ncbi:radical SAM/SPASM domain-containing protein [Enterococcus malodoratus]|uniref:Anaerobic sulfatase maturase n=1 Tax=Enterococcus malodoratus ATCC 43197 TaxID=1158601 RepID=R2QRY7_9ENTE|nr:SPASM domain-containing protein [Enterococcus malodoratus]EOH74405.1 anaerobic sulfatase maturase [Enterococcus malodoratus ATCC 43197]EOT67135.1 anaerobic sulfatase maturase [Enterococcus malodoratus ATCC 43197]SPW90986.1 anaerobic sulfatase maturase [Enterococcus malodoratus]STD69613.1 anaerobic sulfatase maturase [Enterococcus malodoratus]
MKHISVLIKPASSLCNIRCKYCFYADISSLRDVRSYGKMTDDTTQKMIANLYLDLEDGDELTLAFQGGEPTLAGIGYFEKLAELVEQQTKRVTVHYAIQTNGILINQRWCRLFKRYNFLVGLSVDGSPIYHNLNRLDIKGRGTYHRVMATKKLFDDHQINYNILCVLTNQLAKEAKKVFRFLQDNCIRYVQFIPCLDEINAERRSSYALTPQRFATFYQQLFKLWFKELGKGNYISIKLFDDLVHLFARKQVNACGLLGNCQVQYVIEADGSVYPCDFYVLDEYRMGYIQEQGLRELFEQDITKKFLCERSADTKLCMDCPFKNYCGGGCKRMKDAVYVDEQKEMCGYQVLLNTLVPKISAILECLQQQTVKNS